MKRLTLTAAFALLITAVYAQLDTDLRYRVELGATAGGGDVCSSMVHGQPLRTVKR